ncbi:hypothetical protein GPECTOR_104g83 [Gonium pectorale]|uniref:Protein kinase domain-containing protein n=1 Tax=Gonium pectorale TaxID=33097 RepID=A0A150FZR3_GONPE|nr:hypothetical protein GPECTOR_104g83 [Gonium pectorale]|eukprot:KXZ43077.1 hypothetical protein GPECTOR_104g83 [Gonium pectorale]
MPRIFVVPTNGNVALRDLELRGVALPTSPFPLSAAAFLALSAFKLPPASSAGKSSAGNRAESTAAGGSGGGLPLQLSNLLISTPSCVALSLHQHFACRFSPSPNFTVTPTSLTIHRLTTPTADIANVKLVCTGKPASASCLAAAVATGLQLLTSLRTMQAQADAAAAAAPSYHTAPITINIHVCRNLAFTGDGSNTVYSGTAAGTADKAANVVDSGGVATGSSPIELHDVAVVIAGQTPATTSSSASSGSIEGTLGGGSGLSAVPANRSTTSADATLPPTTPSTVLDLRGTGGMFSILELGGTTSVELRDLTIRNPPLGPRGESPWSQLRALLWTFDFQRSVLGRIQKPLLLGSRLTVELQPDELAFWLADGLGGGAAVPRELLPSFCAEGGRLMVTTKDVQKASESQGIAAGAGLGLIAPTQGLPADLANFTSCLWTADFDRPAALAGWGTAADVGAADGEGVRPAGLPYVFLDSVALVVPQAELDWMSQAHVEAMWAGSRLTEASAGLLAAAAVGSGAGTDADARPVVTALSFEVFEWCGLRGRDVTLTSLLPLRLLPNLHLPQPRALPLLPIAAEDDGRSAPSGRSRVSTHGLELAAPGSGGSLEKVLWPHGVDVSAAAAAVDATGGGETMLITGELGRGAQGVVYRGVWRGLPVAVKSLLVQVPTCDQALDGAGPSPTDPRVRQALAEAAISASVDHPNLVATYTYMLQRLDRWYGGCGGYGSDRYASGRSGGSYSKPHAEPEAWKLTLVQELCEGGSLRDCLAKGVLADCRARRLPKPAGALHWGRVVVQPTPAAAAIADCDPYPPVMLLAALQAARGLAHLHSRSVVHADVSSANILLQRAMPMAAAGPATSSPSGSYGTPMAMPDGIFAVCPGGGSGRPVYSFQHRGHGGGAMQGGGNGRDGAGAKDSGSGVGAAAAGAGSTGAECAYHYGWVAKLCDFGLSGRLEAADQQTHLSGSARRSSAYSAPELVRAGRVGPPGDVYSLAVVMWELALGQPLPEALAAPQGQRLRAWLAAQAAADPADAEALPPGLLAWPECTPRAFAELVGECLREAPADRPSAERVCERLEAILTDLAPGLLCD